MSRGFKITLVIIGSAVFLAAMLPAIFPNGVRSARLDRYVCERCAMQREVVSKWWLGIPVGGSDKTIDTSLSQEMAGGKNAKCEHEWVRTYFDIHGARIMGHGGVSSRFAIHYLTEADEGAAGIVEFARATDRPPEEVWRALFRHLANVPRGESSDFERWLFEGNVNDSDDLVSWLLGNYESLRTTTNK